MTPLRKTLLILASGLLYAYALHGPGGWIAGWIWPLPVLMTMPRSGPYAAAGWGFGAWMLGSLAWWPIERGVLPLPAFLAAHAAQALPLALSILVFKALHRQREAWAAWGFASFSTLLSWLAAGLNPHGTWGLMVYTQTWLPVMQGLAWGGPFLLTFLMSALPAAGALLLSHRDREARISFGIAGSLFLALVIAGGLRLSSAQGSPSIRVALAATDRTIPAFKTQRAEEALPVVQAYATWSRALAARGAQLVVLPEKFVGIAPAYEAEADDRFARASEGATLVAGLNATGRSPKLNTARVYVQGRLKAAHLKRHLVPVWEAGYARGATVTTWDQDGHRFGLSICKDFGFTDTSKDLGRAGARLVAAPAWDFAGTEAYHAHMARFRAVEGGFALARCAQEGQLDVWDAHGRSIASAATHGGDAEVLAAVHLGPGGTLYSRWGDWILGICILTLLGLAWPRGSRVGMAGNVG